MLPIGMIGSNNRQFEFFYEQFTILSENVWRGRDSHMKEKFELPIQIENIDCVSACWIYNRLAIIKTTPYYRDWVASHYNLIASNGYGFNFEGVAPSYHDTILLRQQVNLFQLTQENIVEKIKSSLKDGYYVVMTIKQYADSDFMHEVLIYGYDDGTEQFTTVGIEKRIFQTMTFSYSYFESTIEYIKKYFETNEGRSMTLSLSFQYPVTLFKINQKFNPENCVFEAYRKVERELYGESYDLHFAGDFAEYKPHPYGYRYKGICCLDILKQMLEVEIRGEEFHQWFNGITRGVKTLVEHRQMMKISLDYILEKWKLAITEDAYTSAKTYGECCTVAVTWLNLCLKYEITKDKKLLERIVAEIPNIYEVEKLCLETFIHKGIDRKRLNEHYI